MCSNFEPIKPSRSHWVITKFKTDLPDEPWRADAWPQYAAPFVYLKDGKPSCELSKFGMVPFWGADKPRPGSKTYNARSETVEERRTYGKPWKSSQFGIVLVESFYEPNWETGKAVRWKIKRADQQPLGIASIWEKFTDHKTGEIVFSFSMLTVNADGDKVMKHFHKPKDEKRSVVVLTEEEYLPWLNTNPTDALSFLDLAPEDYLISEPYPKN